ncbi:hypothetical protein BLA24_11995 [Streptomyces cinnamoneus]|uniref:Uncharacterized protein n=1 Tax=Streptomyces cinnamoneus TaxID=53446 RepID=A0A2G1XKP0_STRCJ|nr:SH3 domain-containing protein [Streptomyces cinnamoneus]PHQ51797.1 hypothetical protein BLA24_11995 [Streptomyces cinnamoneus]PPT12043.1 SH3 domain-containing protein [Streptomyces cinnamoneus]
MFRTFALRGRKVPAAVLAATVLGGSLLVTGPAQAVPPTRPYGTSTAVKGLNERSYPSTDASVRGVIKFHSQVGVRCKVHAQEVAGNSVWYLLRDRATWVAAKYVENTGDVPLCKAVNRNAMDDSPESHNAVG